MRLLENKTAVIRVWTTFFVGIFVCAFFWWISHQLFGAFQSAGSQMIQDYGTNSTISDGIEIFFSNVDTYILVLALIGLGLWVLQRSQKRGTVIVDE